MKKLPSILLTYLPTYLPTYLHDSSDSSESRDIIEISDSFINKVFVKKIYKTNKMCHISKKLSLMKKYIQIVLLTTQIVTKLKHFNCGKIPKLNLVWKKNQIVTKLKKEQPKQKINSDTTNKFK